MAILVCIRCGISTTRMGRYRASEIIVMDRVQEYMDGPRLLRMHLGELVPLVRVELRSWGWGLAFLPSLHSLAWNCTLGVRWLAPFPGICGVGGGCSHSLAWNCALGVGGWHLSPRCTR